MTKEEILKRLEKDIYQEIDGFFVFDTGTGYLPAYVLRIIADELDRRNEPWEAEINRYFEEQEKQDGQGRSTEDQL